MAAGSNRFGIECGPGCDCERGSPRSTRCECSTAAGAVRHRLYLGRRPRSRRIGRCLRKRRINTSAQIRVYAVIDYDEKGVAASLRISPHYYNTEEEIDQTVSAIRDLLL